MLPPRHYTAFPWARFPGTGPTEYHYPTARSDCDTARGALPSLVATTAISVADAGEFMEVSELRDAMDVSRQLQDALRSYDDIKVATDRLVRVVPDGAGARATFLHGHGEGGEMYTVHYDVLVTTLGSTNSTAEGRNAAGGGPTIKGVLGGMRMQAQRGTQAPVLEDAGTGRVRVIGIAAGENVNVVMDLKSKPQQAEATELKNRRERNSAKISADSPNADVMEGVGRAVRQANASGETEPTQ